MPDTWRGVLFFVSINFTTFVIRFLKIIIMFTTSHFHPMFVHFPVALIIFGFFAAIASLIHKKETWLPATSLYLLILGTLAALVAVLTGVFFTEETTGAANEIGELHEHLAWITLGLLVATSALYIYLKVKKIEKPGLKWCAFALYALSAISVGVTGFYGGTLVYNFMILAH